MDTPEESFKPPYMSFLTFWNFIAELRTKPLPPRIDRSLMSSKSGTDQFNLTLALTSFGLVDDDSRVLPLLQELTAADDEQRKSILAKMVTASYMNPCVYLPTTERPRIWKTPSVIVIRASHRQIHAGRRSRFSFTRLVRPVLS